jgi:hypothetical protein
MMLGGRTPAGQRAADDHRRRGLLILIGCALIMYLVIQWEQHPLLGRMFTQHGDKLSVGGVVGALWGKLAAASIILVPVLFPEVLSGLHGLLQSIDSFR